MASPQAPRSARLVADRTSLPRRTHTDAKRAPQHDHSHANKLFSLSFSHCYLLKIFVSLRLRRTGRNNRNPKRSSGPVFPLRRSIRVAVGRSTSDHYLLLSLLPLLFPRRSPLCHPHRRSRRPPARRRSPLSVRWPAAGSSAPPHGRRPRSDQLRTIEEPSRS